MTVTRAPVTCRNKYHGSATVRPSRRRNGGYTVNHRLGPVHSQASDSSPSPPRVFSPWTGPSFPPSQDSYRWDRRLADFRHSAAAALPDCALYAGLQLGSSDPDCENFLFFVVSPAKLRPQSGAIVQRIGWPGSNEISRISQPPSPLGCLYRAGSSDSFSPLRTLHQGLASRRPIGVAGHRKPTTLHRRRQPARDAADVPGDQTFLERRR